MLQIERRASTLGFLVCGSVACVIWILVLILLCSFLQQSYQTFTYKIPTITIIAIIQCNFYNNSFTPFWTRKGILIIIARFWNISSLIQHWRIFTAEKASDIYRRQANDVWFEAGTNFIKDSLKLKQINSKAKNVILFLGDGMGVSTVTAARILQGQLQGRTGKIALLLNING